MTNKGGQLSSQSRSGGFGSKRVDVEGKSKYVVVGSTPRKRGKKSGGKTNN